MPRLATLPCAVAIERAPITDGVAGTPELMPLRAHVDLGSTRAIYERLADSGKPPAVCVELGDVLWRFIVTSDTLAVHWTDEFTTIARLGRRR